MRMPPARTETAVRPYRSPDRRAVRDIAFRTSFRYRGESIFPGLAEPIADYLTRYSTDYEPHNAWVLERRGHVTGYLLGCSDTSRYARVMSLRIISGILSGAPAFFLRTDTRRTMRRLFRWIVFYSWGDIPPIPLKKFPAHLHFNLLRGFHGLMYGSDMTLLFLNQLRGRGG